MTAGSIFLVAPFVAAASAFDTASMQPTVMEILDGTRRRDRSTLIPAAAVVLWSYFAYVLVWIAIVCGIISAGGITPADLWTPGEVGAALLGAAAVGSLIGTLVSGVGAPVFAAAAVLVAATISRGWGGNLFEVPSTYGTMIGIERTPSRALLLILAHLGLALSAFIVARALRSQSRVAVVASILIGAMSLSPQALWNYDADEYRPVSVAMMCLGRDPAVCGPPRSQAVLRLYQRDLRDAQLRLSGTGLSFPGTFVVARGQRVGELDASQSLLSVTPEDFADGRLPSQVLASILARPRVCAALFEADQAGPYLNLIDGVQVWLTQELAGGTADAAPARIRAAYDKLASCPLRRS